MRTSALFFGVARVPVDFLAVVGGWYVAFLLRFEMGVFAGVGGGGKPAAEEFLVFVLVSAVLFVGLFAMMDMYAFRRDAMWKQMRGAVYGVGLGMLVLFAYLYLTRELFVSRAVLLMGGVSIPALVVMCRVGLFGVERYLLGRGIGRRDAVLVGGGGVLREALEREGYRIVEQVEGMGAVSRVEASGGGDIIVAENALSQEEMREVLGIARNSHRMFSFVPDLLGGSYRNSVVTYVAGVPLVTLLPSPLSAGWGRAGKRLFDLVVGSIALVVTLPLWAVAAIAIAVEGGGPVFFSHYPDGRRALRVGRGGKLFWFIKFRSMVVNDHMSRYAMESHRDGPIVKIAHDPRITRVGRVLRRTSVDELPNLLSVLSGEMSLVGPRPHLPEEVAKYTPEERRVLDIKPGITGLAQVSGRSDLAFHEEVRLDVWYMENWSLWLDIKILFLTVGVVLFPRHKE